MKTSIYIYPFLLILCLTANCHLERVTTTPNEFNFHKWRASVLSQYDELITINALIIEKGLTNAEVVRKEIEYVNNDSFNKIFLKITSANKLKRWDNMYVIYHYFEGEVNFSISSIVFYQHSKSFGMSYNHSFQRYRMTNHINRKDVDKIQSLAQGGGNALIIISKFDRNYHNLFNRILVGVSNEDEVPQIMKIYDISNFD